MFGQYLALVITLSALVCVQSSYMLPNGVFAGDKKMPSAKTGCFELDLYFSLNYLYTSFDKTLICKSGGLSMNGRDGNYYQFNGHNVPVHAGEGNGEVYYRITSNDMDMFVLSSIVNGDIMNARFTALRALFVTWKNIRNKKTSELNTFQIVLATSGTDTFLIMTYDDCDTLPVTCNFPISSTSSAQLPGCPTSSNNNVPHRYIYRVAPVRATTTKKTTTKRKNQASGLTGVSGLICFGVIAVYASAYAFFDN